MIQWILTSCVLILAVLGLRLVLKGRISLRLQYALWLLVAVRLLVPLTFGESNISAANLSQSAQPMVQQMEAVEIPVQSFDSAYEEVVQEHIDLGQDISGFENTEELEYEAYERMEKVSLSQVLLWVWVGGMALSLAALLFSNLHFYFKLRKARRPIVLPDTKLPVYCAPQIVTPCLFGLFRPAIYVTEEVLEDPLALQHVLAHERTHHRHGDHIWSILRGLCLCIHWYNPLVWTAAQVSRRDAELACDEAAIAALGEENRLDYGRTLIGLTCAKGVSPLLTATTMTGSKHSIKERITLIAKKPKFSVIALIALILAMTIAAGCSFTGPATKEDNSKYEIMAFPGTYWCMTPDALMQSLELTEDDVIKASEDDSGSTYFLIVENVNYMGYPVTLELRFFDPTGKYTLTPNGTGFCLVEVGVVFPDDTDMSAILAAMEKEYGEPSDRNSRSVKVGASRDTQGHVVRWDSVETRADLATDLYRENQVMQNFGRYPLHSLPDEEAIAEAREELETYLAIPAVKIYWGDNAGWLYYGREQEDLSSKKMVCFSAEYLHTLRLFDGIPEIEVETPGLPSDYIVERIGTGLTAAKLAELRNLHGIDCSQAKLTISLMDTNATDPYGYLEVLVYKLDGRVKPTSTKNLPDDAALENGWVIAEGEGGTVYSFVRIRKRDGAITEAELLMSKTEQMIIDTYGTEEMLEKYGDMYTAAATEIAYDLGVSIR